jgi:chromate transport protein ChrA
VGQVTPGPVFTTATFVGYVLGGFWGAMVATVGIFLPAFVFVALSGPLVPRIRRSPVAGTFLDGVNVGSIALMAIVTAQLARAAIGDVWTGAVAAASAVLLLRFRASPAWLVPAGGILGLVLPRERAPVIPAGGYGRIFLDWGQVMEPMKILLSLVALVVIALIVVIVWMGSPRGPRLRDVAHLREPRLGTLPPQKVLLVTARGDPNTVGKEAFGQLMRTYFALKGVPKGGPAFKAPRARWPDAGRVPGEWTGLYAMPVPDAVTALPASSAEDGLEVALTTWDYGEVAEILHVGPYSAEEPTIGRLKSFIADQGYEIAGPHEEEYLRGPGMLFAGDPGGYLTLIRYPVRRRAGPSTP